MVIFVERPSHQVYAMLLVYLLLVNQIMVGFSIEQVKFGRLCKTMHLTSKNKKTSKNKNLIHICIDQIKNKKYLSLFLF